MRRAKRERGGAALLEVLLAVAILGASGLAMIALSLDAGRAVQRASVSEADARGADEFLSRVALWDRADLDRHLGEHAQGAWRLAVIRTTPSLYRLVLRDSTGAHLLIATTVYRPAANWSAGSP